MAIQFAVSGKRSATITAPANVFEFPVPCDCTLDRLVMQVLTANGSGDAVFDIRINGTTIYPDPLDRPEIAASTTEGETSPAEALVEGDIVAIDLVTVPAGGLVGLYVWVELDDGLAGGGGLGAVVLTGTPTAGQVPTATDATNAEWADAVGMPGPDGPPGADGADGADGAGIGQSVASYATGGDGSSGSPYTGWDTAITWAGLTYNFDSGADGLHGYYQYATRPDFSGLNNLRLIGDGNVVLKYTGTGVCLEFETNAWLHLEGFTIVGNSGATKGIYAEDQHHFTWRRIFVRDVTAVAYECRWAILGLFDSVEYHPTGPDGLSSTYIPAVGFIGGILGSGETFQANTFINLSILGTTDIGIDLSDSWNNVFQNCSVQDITAAGANKMGVRLASTCVNNTFIGCDFENHQNANVADFVDNGRNSKFINCLGTVGITLGATSRFAEISGGSYDDITITAGATNPTVSNHPAWNVMGTGAVSIDTAVKVFWLSPIRNFATDALSQGGPRINVQTGTSYTFLASDNGGVVHFSNGSAIAVTVPASLGDFSVLWEQIGAGQVTFTGSGATVNNRQGHTKSAGQWAGGSLVGRANVFVLMGDTAT